MCGAGRGEQTKGYAYSGSDDVGNVAWYKDNSGSKTHPVGQKQANELGIFDMNGNVWEWCWDWYNSDYYRTSPSTDPKGPDSGTSRVLQGGSWSHGPGNVRCAYRIISDPGGRYSDVGFRWLRTY